jgi:hypothetical protein
MIGLSPKGATRSQMSIETLLVGLSEVYAGAACLRLLLLWPSWWRHVIYCLALHLT